MVNPKILDYIRSEITQGYSSEQLKESLIQQGWNSDEVNEAVEIVSKEQLTKLKSSGNSKSKHFIIILAFFIIVFVIATTIFVLFRNSETIDEKETLFEGNKQTNTEQEAEVKLDETCDVLPDKLENCEAYKCQFQHPFTGELMQKEITGIEEGKCVYIEQMPNNGKMECSYTSSMRKAISQYYRDLASAESTGTQINIDLGSGETKTKYTIDGKEVENPLQEAMSNGQCVISGY